MPCPKSFVYHLKVIKSNQQWQTESVLCNKCELFIMVIILANTRVNNFTPGTPWWLFKSSN